MSSLINTSEGSQTIHKSKSTISKVELKEASKQLLRIQENTTKQISIKKLPITILKSNSNPKIKIASSVRLKLKRSSSAFTNNAKQFKEETSKVTLRPMDSSRSITMKKLNIH